MLRIILLEFGDRAPDKNAPVFTNIDGLKENVQTKLLLPRPNLVSEAEQLAERAGAKLFRGRHQRRPS